MTPPSTARYYQSNAMELYRGLEAGLTNQTGSATP